MSVPLRASFSTVSGFKWLQGMQRSIRTWVARLRHVASENRLQVFAYQRQETTQSLRQGLEEYYASDPALLAPADVSSDIAVGLRAHDAMHVVFGCDTSVRGEVVLARWSVFGAKNAMAIYLHGLRSKETRYLFSDFIRKIRPLTLLIAGIDSGRALLRSLRMRKRWPLFDWEQYADRPLAEIRGDFGIRVV